MDALVFERWLKGVARPGISLGLDATRSALAVLSANGVVRPPAVVVVGTHGKGTTSSLLASLLEEGKGRVGLFTSPHLVYVSERFRFGGALVEVSRLWSAATRLLGWLAVDGVALTFFELTFVLAVLVFSELGATCVVFEAGLGGRLDCVNTLDPLLCVMTPLGLDHQEYLGETIQEIFFEKVAVSRPGVPLLISEQAAEEVGACVRQERVVRPAVLWSLLSSVSSDRCEQEEPLPPAVLERVGGRVHASCALFASRYLLSGALSQTQEYQALSRVRWPGRMDRRSLRARTGLVELFLDGAHHPESMSMLGAQLEMDGRLPPIIFLGTLSNRDSALMYALAASISSLVVCVTGFHELSVLPGHARPCGDGYAWVRADEVLELVAWLSPDLGMSTSTEAEADMSSSPPLVCGSLYLIGHLMRAGGVSPDDLSLW